MSDFRRNSVVAARFCGCYPIGNLSQNQLIVMLLFLKHLLQMAEGIGAGAACLGLLQLIGLLSVTPKRSDQPWRSPRAAIVGAAITILWCAYGLQLNVTLPRLFVALTCLVLLFLVIRRAFILEQLRTPFVARRLPSFFATSVLFFAIAYLFMMPPASSRFLPMVFNGNNDIFNYINCTAYLQRLGPSNIANFVFRIPPGGAGVGSYDQVPAVFYLLDAISAFFNGDVMRGAMPTMFVVVALIGCTIARLSRMVFNLPKVACVSVAAVVISGPFFRYNMGYYFLSQLVGTLVVLLLLGETVRILKAGLVVRLGPLFLEFLPFHIILCFSYPVLSLVGLALQLGLVSIYHALNMAARSSEAITRFVQVLLIWIGASVLGVACSVLVDPWHGVLTVRNLQLVSTVGAIGWVQDFISPLAIIGFPVSTQVSDVGQKWILMFGTVVSTLLLGWMIARLRALEIMTYAVFVLTGLSFFVYFVYFLKVGPSYQQWKLAGCLPLIMSFAIVAAGSQVSILASDKWLPNALHRRLSNGLIGSLVCMVLVSTNLAKHYLSDPPPPRFSSAYANLGSLESMADVQSIFVQMDSFSTTFFPVYFIRNKLLHLISPSYYSQEALNLREVSARTPLLFEGEVCEADQQHLPIPGVGCLYSLAPTLTPDRSYLFNRTIPEIGDAHGLSVREGWGRWSSKKDVELSLYSSGENIEKTGSGFLNLNLSVFLPPSVSAQHVSFRWGKDRRGSLALSERGWVSLPVSAGDWTSGEIRKISIEFDLPDAISPQTVDASNLDTRTLAIGFIELSWTSNQVGRSPN